MLLSIFSYVATSAAGLLRSLLVVTCMVQALYNLLPTFHDGQSHRRQLSKSLWRTVRQRQRLIFAFVLAFIFCATSFKVIVSSRKRWPMVPVAPPTPFILKGLPSSESTTLSAPYLTSSFPAPQYRPACAPLTSISPRYASLSTSKSNSTIYLALNLLDAQAVLPTFIHELPALLSYMGSRRFHVSILENGSKDMSADLLVALARALASVGCSYEVSKLQRLLLSDVHLHYKYYRLSSEVMV